MKEKKKMKDSNQHNAVKRYHSFFKSVVRNLSGTCNYNYAFSTNRYKLEETNCKGNSIKLTKKFECLSRSLASY